MRTDDCNLLQTCDCIIDCTGDDSVLERLAVFDWEDDKEFITLSLGYQARRLWCFSAKARVFPHGTFDILIAPWLVREAEEYPNKVYPREGVGCWHPVFPARADDIMLFAPIAVKYIAARLSGETEASSLTVYTQHDEAGHFRGVDMEELGNGS